MWPCHAATTSAATPSASEAKGTQLSKRARLELRGMSSICVLGLNSALFRLRTSRQGLIGDPAFDLGFDPRRGSETALVTFAHHRAALLGLPREQALSVP